jgi:hypothetical protein
MNRDHFYSFGKSVFCSAVQRMKMVTAIVILLASSASATAAEPTDEWELGLEVYLWGAAMDAQTAEDEINVPFSDLLNNLKMGFMSTVSARKQKFLMFADVIYLDVSKKKKNSGEIDGTPIDGSAKLELTGWISTFGGGYALISDAQNSLEMVVGARYLNLDTTFTLNVDEQKKVFDLGGSVWDGIIGLNGRNDFSEKWYFDYYADVGTGDSDLTWQALAGFGYKLSKADLVFGYRYLDWSFDDKSGLEDLNISGVYAGARWTF